MPDPLPPFPLPDDDDFYADPLNLVELVQAPQPQEALQQPDDAERDRIQAWILAGGGPDLQINANADPKKIRLAALQPKPILSIPPGSKKIRKHPLLPCAIPYENIEEIRLRLVHSVIAYNGLPYYIVDASRYPDEQIILSMSDTQTTYHVLYDPGMDLRSFSPRYIQYRGETRYLVRRPARVYKQGLTSENVAVIALGGKAGRKMDIPEILFALRDTPDIKWAGNLEQLLSAEVLKDFRLTEYVAVYKSRKTLHVEYKGRVLGTVKDERVIINPIDMDKSWIVEDLLDAGLTPEAA